MVAAFDAFVLEPRWLQVSRHTIRVVNLPLNLNGWTVAHVTDVHLRTVNNLHEAIAEACRDAQCIAVTGDVIDSPSALPALEAFTSLLRQRRATILATAGNWEHWGNISNEALARSYARAGARYLSNQTLTIDGIAIAATDDSCSGHEDLNAALSQLAQTSARIFLTHAPGIFDSLPAEAPQFSLALAGHTHGGQVTAFSRAITTPPGSGSYVHGWYSTRFGAAYVSRGVGTSIIPARFFCRPELALFRFERA